MPRTLCLFILNCQPELTHGSAEGVNSKPPSIFPPLKIRNSAGTHVSTTCVSVVLPPPSASGDFIQSRALHKNNNYVTQQ
jgi:hypothetical protein